MIRSGSTSILGVLVAASLSFGPNPAWAHGRLAALPSVPSLAPLPSLASLPSATPRMWMANPAAAGTVSVLGLDGSDTEASKTLTNALRQELGMQGRAGSEELTLVELKLTMGCEGENVACLAEGGRTLGAAYLVYGTLSPKGTGYTLELRAIDVAHERVGALITTDLDANALASPEISNTAQNLLERVLGFTGDNAATTDAETLSPPPAAATEDEGKRYIWGRHRPLPGWKKAGLWTSVALTAAGLGTGLGLWLSIRRGGTVHDELLQTAANSLRDGKPSNDIDPNSSANLCDLARATPPGASPGEVRNAAVTVVCNKGDQMATGATAAFVLTGIFGVATAVFATLAFVRKAGTPHEAGRRAKTRGLRLTGVDAGPLRGGGFVSVGGRF